VTYDVSVIATVIVFIVYAFLEDIDVLGKNLDAFLAMKVVPSSVIFSYFTSLNDEF
jgi:hypothetical protein